MTNASRKPQGLQGSSIVAVLQRRAREDFAQPLFTFLENGETESASLTAGQLDLTARRLASYLQDQGLSGKRVLLAYPPGLDFVVSFFGCLYAQAVAVPAYPPRRKRRDARLEAIAQDARVAAVLTVSGTADASVEPIHCPGDLKALPWLATDRPLDASADGWQPPEMPPQQLAYLQYTSGSAGVPKGVMVSHDNIIQNSKCIQPACTLGSDPKAVTWLPSFHDMGLIDGIIQPVFSGYHTYVMSPQSFVERPIRWLQAISRYRLTHSGGPDFGYRLCIDRVTAEEREALDLSCWVNAYTGAEPIRSETLRQFAEYFSPCGFQSRFFFPCYGMAETTLMISGGPLRDAPTFLDLDAKALEQHRVVTAGTDALRTVVGCGPLCINTDVAIVNPDTAIRCRSDEVGEIWVAGGSVTQGYWNRAEETTESFSAFIKGTGEGPYLRTGDLGFVHEGQLYIAGRCKDLIIIRGRNHYPQDIEQTAEQSHPALRPGAAAAFSVEADGEERLVLVHEVQRTWIRKFDVDDVAAAICAAVTAEHDVAVHALCFIKPARLPMTSSGKIQRRSAKAAWLSQELQPLAEWVRPTSKSETPATDRPSEPALDSVAPSDSRPEIERWLRREVAWRLKMPPESIDTRAPLAQYGLDSVAAVELTPRLQDRLGVPLSATIFYDYPTIASLAAFLAGTRQQPAVRGTDGCAARDDEPVAIIGMACRFPGAESCDGFWSLLRDGTDAISAFPASRDRADRFSPDSLPPDATHVQWGGFLDEVADFDASFFGIAPREAESMDPQQRLLLEVSWQALEDAGLDVERIAGTAAGAFVGISNHDYARGVMSATARPDAWLGTGNALSIAANRLSYFFNLRGPSLAIDTACSSSLVAVHQACQSLRHGESELALAGGVNLILGPELSLAFAEAGMMASDGRCKAFDAAADGYVRGEGCGMVVLKRLADAQRDGDRVWAVLLGSAVNQDGRSNGLTAPNGPSQKAVIERAVAAAGIAPADLGLIEAHGTGTSLGDPIELNTLAETLLPGRTAEQPCYIGSVKTNIGHLEAAAGIAGLIKAALAIHHGQIPAQLHLKKLNPLVEFDPARFQIPVETVSWAQPPNARVAGVSSFGFGGTNAHVVVGSAPLGASRQSQLVPSPDVARQQPATMNRPVHLLNLSAKSELALRELSAQYAEYLQGRDDLPLADVCFSANAGRSHLTQRLSLIVESQEDATRQLSQFAAGQTGASQATGKVLSGAAPRIAFLMTGQGSQVAGMGRELYDSQPVFRETLDRCAEGLAADLKQPLLEVLFARDSAQADRLSETQYTQPALFALEYALAEMWRSWGCEPEWVMGHSVGEYVAACTAGVFTLEDALKLIAGRARLMQALPSGGGMLAVAADEATVSEAIRPWQTAVSLAAINGPANTVVSGDSTSLEQVASMFANRGVKTTVLAVSHGFHSPQIEPMLDDFCRVAEGIRFTAPTIPIISNITGEPVTDAITTPQYWRDHARQPVQFARGVRALRRLGATCFLEIGPKPTLLAMGQDCVDAPEAAWLPSLWPGRSEWSVLLASLRELYLSGASIDWHGFERGYASRKVSLPMYPFQRKRYWIQASDRPQPGLRSSRPTHPLLGERIASALPDAQFHNVLSVQNHRYLSDHRVFQRTLLPAAGFLELGLAAGKSLLKKNTIVLKDVVLHQALELPDETTATIQTVVSPDGPQWKYRVFSLNDAEGPEATESWTTHLSAALDGTANEEPGSASAVDLAEKRSVIDDVVDIEALYAACEACGLTYGPAFRALAQVWRNQREALGRLQLPSGLSTQGYQLHPVLLDACFQLIAAAVGDSLEGTFVPVGLEQLIFHGGQDSEGWGYAHVDEHEADAETILADVTLFSADGQVIAELQRLMLRRTDSSMLADQQPARVEDWLYQVQWKPSALQRGHARVLPADFLPATGEVASAVCGPFRESVSSDEFRRYGAGLAQLDRLSVAFVTDALRKLGLDYQRQRPFALDDMCCDLGIVDGHRRLAARMLAMLEEHGILTRRGETWHVQRPPAAADPQAQQRQVLSHYPEIKIELELLSRCAGRLDDVLRGNCDPIQLLFPRADLTSAARLYHDTPGAKLLNGAVLQSVMGLVQQRPWWRGMRILEIGAGTGGTTACLLPHLPAEATEYVFTDVSTMFTEQARQKFADFDFVRYQSLDIERSPVEQGFAQQGFDVIVAANVLHATSDLRRTLGHVQQLLAPGGALLLLEGTRPVGWLDLIFGLTKGWWKFTDHELRPSHPLLSPEKWQSLLGETGFPDVSCITADAQQRHSLAHQAVIVARGAAPAPQVVSVPPTDARQWIIFADETGVGTRLVQHLRQRGRNCAVVLPGDAFGKVVQQNGNTPLLCEYHVDQANPDDYGRLFAAVAESQVPVEGVVYLWGLDQPTPTSTAPVAPGDLASLTGVDRLLCAVKAVAGAEFASPPPFWLITRNASAVGDGRDVNGLWRAPMRGLVETAALECPEFQWRQLDLAADWDGRDSQALFDEIWSQPEERRVAFHNRRRRVARLVRLQSMAAQTSGVLEIPSAEAFQLTMSRRGSLDDLTVQASRRSPPGAGQIAIQVAFAGLNFRDVLNALDLYPGDPGPLGGECAGVVTSVGDGVSAVRPGDRVIAIAPAAFGNSVTVHQDFVAACPGDLSLEQAATIPIAFATAWYTLVELGSLRSGQRVLIHAASGGVGQAAIQVARHVGAEIFCTASLEKHEVVRQLGVRHVFDSRTTDFEPQIRLATGGEGVDVVLNSLTGQAVSSSLALLRQGGRFLEIGKRDIRDDASVAALHPHVIYRAFDLADLCRTDPNVVQLLLGDLVERFCDGSLRPLPLRTFALEQAQAAFRWMQQARHTGKLVLQIPPGSSDSPLHPVSFQDDASYLISGGLGALGLLTARWMVQRGARHLVLLGRSAPDGEAASGVAELEAAGAEVRVVQADVAAAGPLQDALAEIKPALPPLRGVVHAAGTLEDGVLAQQTPEQFNRVMAPKVAGAWNLHLLTQDDELDFFVMYSSAASLLGSAGQANHAAANAFLDALAHRRRAAGLPAVSINWGVWSGIGAAEKRRAGARFSGKGMGTIAPAQGLEVIERLWVGSPPQIGVLPIDWQKFVEHYPDPSLLAEFQGERDSQAADSTWNSILEQTPEHERLPALQRFVAAHVARVLGLESPADVDPEVGFFDLGMDSLTSVELKNRLQAELACSLPTTAVFDFPNVETLTRFLASEVLHLAASTEHGSPSPQEEDDDFDELDELSEAELADLLSKKLASMA